LGNEIGLDRCGIKIDNRTGRVVAKEEGQSAVECSDLFQSGICHFYYNDAYPILGYTEGALGYQVEVCDDPNVASSTTASSWMSNPTENVKGLSAEAIIGIIFGVIGTIPVVLTL